MSILGRWRQILMAVVLAMAASTAAEACTVSSSVVTNLGSYSPAAVKAGAVPGLQSRAGLTCNASVLVLLGGNYIRATFNSQNGFRLMRAGGGTVTYRASADPAGTYAFAQGSTVDYMQNNLLNLLGLLGGSSADLPFFVTPAAAATAPATGVYTDRITIDWNWYLCPGGISLAGLCLGTLDTGTGRSTIDVTLTVTPKNATIAIASTTTWDPVNGTSSPKALPGSRRRLSVGLANPDLVPLDGNTLGIALPTPAGTVVALDGDGATSGAAINATDGSPASTMTLRYNGPADTGDDVDFSADGGQTWTYVPVAGNVTSEGNVTHVRLRPQGAMAKQSSFSVTVPYLVR